MNKSIATPTPTELQAVQLRAALPTPKLQKHQSLAKQQEQAMWESGLWALELQEEYYPAYSKAAIRKMVADVYDISVSTVRDRERVAGAVPKDLRDMAPYLKYHHWRNIISAGQEKGEQLLVEAAMLVEHEGKGPSVDQIIAWRDQDEIDATPPWIYRLQGGLEKMEMVRDDPLADKMLRDLFAEFIRKVEDRIRQLKLWRFEARLNDENSQEDLEDF